MSKKRKRQRRKSNKSRNKQRNEQQNLRFEALEPRKLLAADLVVDAMGLNVELFQDGSTVQVYGDGGTLLAESEIADIEDKVHVFNAYSINFESDLELDGNSLELQANDSITLGSFYNVITTDDNNDNPINDAGDVTFDAPQITISENAVVDTWDEHSNNVPGDITLTAIDTPSFAETVFNASPLPATVNFRDPMVTLDNARLDGGLITISALGQTTTRYGDLGRFSDTISDELNNVNQLDLNSIGPISGQAKIHDSNATITIDSTTINSQSSIEILADARTDASMDAISVSATKSDGSDFLGAIGFGKAFSDARVDVLGSTAITAEENIDIQTYAESIANVSSRAVGGERYGSDVDNAFNISIALTEEHSNVVMEPGTSVTAGYAASIKALGKVENKAKAATTLFQPEGESESSSETGLSLALGVDTAVIKADIAGIVAGNRDFNDQFFYVSGSNVEPDNVTLRIGAQDVKLLKVGEVLTYDSANASDLGIEPGDYVVASAIADGVDEAGYLWQKIQLAKSNSVIDLDARQVPDDSTHTLSKLNRVVFNADETSADNFVHLPGLPAGVTEVTYLGPNLETEPDAEGIDGLEQNATYSVESTGVDDQYRLRLDNGQYTSFQVPDGGSHGFYFTETVLSFNPRNDVNDESNEITLPADHGLEDGDLVFYGTNPDKFIERIVQSELSDEAGIADLPDAPIRGLQNELGYRVIVNPTNPELIRLTTSLEAVEQSQVVTFNPNASPDSHTLSLQSTSVDIQAHLDARNTADAGVALSDKPQSWAEVAFTAAETDIDNMVDGGNDLFVHMRFSGGNSTDAATSMTDTSISGQGGSNSTTEASGSMAFSSFDHDVYATVRETAFIQAGIDFNLDATIEQAVQLSIVSESNRRGTGDDNSTNQPGSEQREISAAFGSGKYDNDAQATISDSSLISVGTSLDVHAGIDYPLLMDDVTEGLNANTYLERIGSAAFGSLLDGMLGVSQLFNVTARTNAGGDGDKLSLGGAVVITDYVNNVLASIDTTHAVDIPNIDVAATFTGEVIEVGQMASMNLDLQGLLESPIDALNVFDAPFGLKGDKAIGGVALFTTADNSTIAEIGAATELVAENINVEATSDFLNLSFVQTGAKSTDLGFSAAIAASTIGSKTEASIEDGASITASTLNVNAMDNIDRKNIVGGILLGKQTGIGTSIGVNNVTQDVAAFVGREDAKDLANENHPFQTTLDVTGTLVINANADGDIFSLVMAGAVQGLGSGSDDNPSGASARANSSKVGAIAFTVPVAINNVTTDVAAYLDHQLVVGNSSLEIDSESNVDVQAVSIGGSFAVQLASNPGKVSLAAAGAVTVNTVIQNVAAFMKDSRVQFSGNRFIRASDNSTVEADSGGFGITLAKSPTNRAALSFGISAAVNDVGGEIHATVDNVRVFSSAIANSALYVLADSNSVTNGFAIAGALSAKAGTAPGGSFGGAGSAVLNTVGKTVSAKVNDSDMFLFQGKLVVEAKDNTEVIADAGAGAIGTSFGSGTKIAAAAAVSPAFNEVSNSVTAEIDSSNIRSKNSNVVHAESNAVIDAFSLGAAVGVNVGTGSSPAFDFGGSGSQNSIANSIVARVVDSTLDSDNSTYVFTRDGSTIKATAIGASLAISGGTAPTGALAVGLSLAHNEIANEVKSEVLNSEITSDNGTVSIRAQDNASISSVAVAASVGIGVSPGSPAFGLSGGGAVSTNSSLSTLEATVENSDLWAGHGAYIYAVSNTDLAADVFGAFASGAGSGGVAGSASIGAAVANNSIGSVDGVPVESGAMAKAIGSSIHGETITRVLAYGNQSIRSDVSVASTAISGAGGFGAAGAGSGAKASNKINRNIHAIIDGYDANGTSTGARIDSSRPDVYAYDVSTISSSVAAAAIGVVGSLGNGAALSVGIADANNEISNDIKAHALNVPLLHADGPFAEGNAFVRAIEEANISATATAVGISATLSSSLSVAVGGGGASSTNSINNTVEALTDNTFFNALSPTVVADDSSVISANIASGNASIGVGGLAGAASIGVAIAENQIGDIDEHGNADGTSRVSAIVRNSGTNNPAAFSVNAISDQTVSANVQADATAAAAGPTSGSAAVTGSSAINTVATQVESLVVSDRPLTRTLSADQVNVTAVDNSVVTSDVGATSVALAVGFNSATVSAAVSKSENLIANDVSARVEGALLAGNIVNVSATENAVSSADATTAAVDVNLSIGVSVGGGGAVANSTINSDVSAEVVDGRLIGVDSVDIMATNTATADSDTHGIAVTVALGALGGQGSVSTSNIGQDTTAIVSGTSISSKDIDIHATSTPVAMADAAGFSITTGGTVGVSSANTNIDGLVKASVGNFDNANPINADVLDVRSTLNSGIGSHAIANASGGGLAASAQAAISNMTNDVDVEAEIAAGSTLNVAETTNVIADRNTNQHSQAKAISGGLVAAGITTASSDITGNTEARVANGVTLTGGSLNVEADGRDEHLSHTTAGAGGITSGTAAVPTTTNISDTTSTIGENTVITLSGSLTHTADHTANVNSTLTAASGGILTGGGGALRNNVDSDVKANFGVNAEVTAAEIDSRATNNVDKPTVAGGHANGTTGGLVAGAGLVSKTELKLDTEVNVKENADLNSTTGSINLRALNTIDASDQVTVRTGGVASGGYTESSLKTLTNNAKVNVDGDVKSENELNVSARGNADVDIKANSETYGAATVGAGRSEVDIRPVNKVNINASANIEARRDLNLSAGSDAAFNEDQYELSSLNDTFAGSVIPIEDVDAVTTLDQSNTVEVKAGATVRSGGNARLHTGRYENQDLETQAKAVTWVNGAVNAINNLLGAGGVEELNGGTVIQNVDGNVIVNGSVETGIHRKHGLVIEDFARDENAPEVSDGTPDDISYYQLTTSASESGDADVELIPFSKSFTEIQSELDAEIEALEDKLISHEEDTALRQFYQSQIDALRQKQLQQGIANQPIPGSDEIIRRDQNILLVKVPSIRAEAGTIDVRADDTGFTQNGTLSAPGDASVNIDNRTPLHLEIEGIEIPASNGGIYFNGQEIVEGGSIEPSIRVENSLNFNGSNWSSDQFPWPNISVTGPVSNLGGSLDLLTYQGGGGSIDITGSIQAKAPTIKAGNNGGTVNIDSGSNFNVGGSEPENFLASAGYAGNSRASSSAVTNFLNYEATQPDLYGDRIFVTAEYINVNGLIQSGHETYDLRLQESLTTFIEANRPDASAADQTIQLPIDFDTNEFGAIFDYSTNRIVVDEVRAGGGYVDLTGRITNTRNGKIKALGGYGRIDVYNGTGYDIELNRLDASQRGSGVVKILDTSKQTSTRSGLTTYQTTGDLVEVLHDTNDSRDTQGRSWTESSDLTYQPRENLRLGWTVTQGRTDVYSQSFYSDAVWGAFDINSGTGDIDYSSEITSSARIQDTEASGPRFFIGSSSDPAYSYSYNSVNNKDTTKTYPGREVWYGWGPWSWSRKHWSTVRTVTSQQWFRHELAADRPVDIEFTGQSEGAINIRTEGDIFVAGELSNPTGPTSVVVNCIWSNTDACSNDDPASVLPVNDEASIGGKSIFIATANDIGNPDQQPLRTNLTDIPVYDFVSGGVENVFKGHRVRVLPTHGTEGVYRFIGDAPATQAWDVPLPSIDLAVEDFTDTNRWELIEFIETDAIRLLNEFGHVHVEEVSGDFVSRGLEINRSGDRTTDGDVRIIANGDIRQTASDIQGNSIELISRYGNVGSQSDPLHVEYRNATQGIDNNINVTAAGDVFLSHTTDLVVDTINAGGNVWIDGHGTGALIDGNTLEDKDDRALSELRSTVWDALDLTNAESRLGELRDQIITGQNLNYNEYWDLRTNLDSLSQDQMDRYNELHSFDPDFVAEVSPEEQDNIRKLGETNGLSGAELDTYVTDEVAQMSNYRTHRYREMHNMGSYGDVRIADFNYDNYELPLADTEEIDGTKVWTEEELRTLRSRDFLEVTDTEFAIEENNITAGGNVTIVNSDGVGRYMNVRRVPVLDSEGEVTGSQLDAHGTTIKLTDDNGEPAVLTLDQRAAIDAAEQHDIVFLAQAPISTRAEFRRDTIVFVNDNGSVDYNENWTNYGFSVGQKVFIEATRNTSDSGVFFDIDGISGPTMRLIEDGPGRFDDPANFESLVSNILIAPTSSSSTATHMRVLHREDIDFDVAGSLSVSSDRQVFIGSESPSGLLLDEVVTGIGQRLQVKSKGNIGSVPEKLNIQGGRLTLESAEGSIDSRIHANRSGYLIARAQDDIQIEQLKGSSSSADLTLNQIFSRSGSVNITSEGSIRKYVSDNSASQLNIKANDISLTSIGGSVGQWEKALKVDAGPTGLLTLTSSDDVYVTEIAGDMRLSSVVGSGDVYLEAPNGSIIADPELDANSIMIDANRVYLHANSAIGADGQYLRFEANNIEAKADSGSIHLFTRSDITVGEATRYFDLFSWETGLDSAGEIDLRVFGTVAIESDVTATELIHIPFQSEFSAADDVLVHSDDRILIRNYFYAIPSTILILGEVQANVVQLSGGDLEDTIDFRPHTLTGSVYIHARDGDDTVYGSDFVETIDGGEGCDTILSGGGLDIILNPDACDSYGELIFMKENPVHRSMANGEIIGDLNMDPSNADDQLTFSLEDSIDGLLAINGNQIVIGDASKIRQHEGQQISFTVLVDHGEGGTTTRTFTLDIDWHEVAEVIEDRVVVADGTGQRSLVNQLQVTFAGPVDIDAEAFKVKTRGTDSIVVPTEWTTSFDEFGNTVATLAFSGTQTREAGALNDRYYELSVDPTRVRRSGTSIDLDGDADGIAGGEFLFGDREEDKFFAMYGDFNGNANVNISDLLRFRSAWQTTSDEENFDSAVDYQSDGIIDVLDLLRFRNRYGTSLTFE